MSTDPQDLPRVNQTPRPRRRLIKTFLQSWSQPRGRRTPDVEGTTRGLIEICHSLMSQKGEVSGGQFAAEAIRSYLALDSEAVSAFLERLVDEFSPSPAAIRKAYEAFAADPSTP